MENGLTNVARALPADRYETHVVCLERTGPFAARLPQPELVHVLHKSPGISLRTIWRLRRLLRQLQPDLIHTHNLGPLIYASLATFGGHTHPILHGEHHVLPDAELTPRKRRWRTIFYRSCQRVHTVSQGLRAQLIGLGLPANNIVPLLNGVDTEKFRPADGRAARSVISQLPADALVLGMVGRFGSAKGHALVIEAFGQLAAQMPHAHLLIVGGGGSEEARVKALASASPATARIHFAGFQETMPPYYQAMDAVIIPGLQEGMSNAVLEAMACGVPVFAQPACGNPEIITHGEDGVLAPLAHATDLTALLQDWLTQPAKLAELGRAARKTILRRFQLTNMTTRYRELYEQLLPAT